MEEFRINLGSGRDYRDGWINVDSHYPGPINVNNDIVTLTSFRNGIAIEMLASHSLEHLSKNEAWIAVRRWMDVLKPGGLLTIVVPNIPVMMRLWIEAYDKGAPDVWGFRSQTIWGNQNHGGEFHRYGYDVDSLRSLLEDAGYVNVDIVTEPGKDLDYGWVDYGQIRATARKPEDAAAT